MLKCKYIILFIMGAFILSGCSTKKNELCLFGMHSYTESYSDYANPVYLDTSGKELSWKAKTEILKQAERYAQDSINEDYVLAESLCPKLNTGDVIFEKIHVDVDTQGKANNVLTVPFDYTGSQAAAVQLYNDKKKSYSSRISGKLGDKGKANMVVRGPCFNNICTESELMDFCKTKQRTALTDKKAIDYLKTYYICEHQVKITYPSKNKKVYECERPNFLRW
ncbi:hypothetical protein AB7Y64_14820 [Providencia rettgeri]